MEKTGSDLVRFFNSQCSAKTTRLRNLNGSYVRYEILNVYWDSPEGCPSQECEKERFEGLGYGGLVELVSRSL